MSNKPEAGDAPARSAVSAIQADAKAVEAFVERALAGIEAWYAEHFHHAAVTGSAPISADAKAALVKHVKAAIATPKE